LRHELLDIAGEGFYLIWGGLPRIFQYEGVEGTHAGFPYLEAFEAGFLNQPGGTELEFVIMVIAVSCVKLLSAHNSTQHTSRKHKV
jgi:hypothetical protein